MPTTSFVPSCVPMIYAVVQVYFFSFFLYVTTDFCSFHRVTAERVRRSRDSSATTSFVPSYVPMIYAVVQCISSLFFLYVTANFCSFRPSSHSRTLLSSSAAGIVHSLGNRHRHAESAGLVHTFLSLSPALSERYPFSLCTEFGGLLLKFTRPFF